LAIVIISIMEMNSKMKNAEVYLCLISSIFVGIVSAEFFEVRSIFISEMSDVAIADTCEKNTKPIINVMIAWNINMIFTQFILFCF